MGERQFSAGYRAVIAKDYIRAFLHASAAVKSAPWNPRYRMQLTGSLDQARNANARVSEAAWERAYAVSRSASPLHPSVLVARATRLIDTRGDAGELALVMAQLRRTAAHYPETWLLDALVNFKDRNRVGQSLTRAIALGGKTKKVAQVARLLKMEITEQ